MKTRAARPPAVAGLGRRSLLQTGTSAPAGAVRDPVEQDWDDDLLEHLAADARAYLASHGEFFASGEARRAIDIVAWDGVDVAERVTVAVCDFRDDAERRENEEAARQRAARRKGR